MRKDPPALAKREEQQHKDLDGDGEKGEPLAHQRKVLSKKTLSAKERTAPKTSKVVDSMKKQAKTPKLALGTKMKASDGLKADGPLAGATKKSGKNLCSHGKSKASCPICSK